MKKQWILMLANEDKEVKGNRELVKDIRYSRKPSKKGIERMMIKYSCKYAWVREEHIRKNKI